MRRTMSRPRQPGTTGRADESRPRRPVAAAGAARSHAAPGEPPGHRPAPVDALPHRRPGHRRSPGLAVDHGRLHLPCQDRLLGVHEAGQGRPRREHRLRVVERPHQRDAREGRAHDRRQDVVLHHHQARRHPRLRPGRAEGRQRRRQLQAQAVEPRRHDPELRARDRVDRRALVVHRRAARRGKWAR